MFPVLSFEIRARMPSECCLLKNCWLNQTTFRIRESRAWVIRRTFSLLVTENWNAGSQSNASPFITPIFNLFPNRLHPHCDISINLFLFRFSVAVNSEANARRITMVESCFGSSGEVSEQANIRGNVTNWNICFFFRFRFQPLKIHGRVLVGEGVLTKMCRKRPKARQFFLFNDILVYGNIVISKKKYNKQHIIPLEEVQLQGLEDNGLGRKWRIYTSCTHSHAHVAGLSVARVIQFIWFGFFSVIFRNRIS